LVIQRNRSSQLNLESQLGHRLQLRKLPAQILRDVGLSVFTKVMGLTTVYRQLILVAPMG
jgi:hypothetical protein